MKATTIIFRYFIAALLGAFPIMMGLVNGFREDWWVVPALIANVILQFVLAYYNLKSLNK